MDNRDSFENRLKDKFPNASSPGKYPLLYTGLAFVIGFGLGAFFF